MGSDMLPEPEYARNMRLIGFTEMDGRSDGVQIMVNKGHAIVGHMFLAGLFGDRRARPAPPPPGHLHSQSA